MMPLPDPKRLLQQTKDVFQRARAYFTRVIPHLAVVNRKQKESEGGYLQDFEQAPASYAEDNSDDDDSEDVGKTAGFDSKLNYDSDEKVEGTEQSELITLDNLPKPQKKQVQKLKMP